MLSCSVISRVDAGLQVIFQLPYGSCITHPAQLPQRTATGPY
jgi:hypothetical protein